jgi:hypothetical protein
MEALAAELPHSDVLLMTLHPFGNHLKLQTTGQGTDGSDNCKTV